MKEHKGLDLKLDDTWRIRGDMDCYMLGKDVNLKGDKIFHAKKYFGSLNEALREYVLMSERTNPDIRSLKDVLEYREKKIKELTGIWNDHLEVRIPSENDTTGK